jgi:hypothetical protein
VRHIFILLDVHFLVINKNNRAFVAVLSAVVRRGEDSDNRGEGCGSAPSVHLVTIYLDLMGANHTNIVVVLENFFHRFKSKLH